MIPQWNRISTTDNWYTREGVPYAVSAPFLLQNRGPYLVSTFVDNRADPFFLTTSHGSGADVFYGRNSSGAGTVVNGTIIRFYFSR